MIDIKSTIDLIRKRGVARGMDPSTPVGLRGSFGDEMEILEARREIVWVANTDAIDLAKEVVRPDGARKDSYFFKNQKVFVDHDYRFQSAIGRMHSATMTTNSAGRQAWKCRVVLDDSPLATAVLNFARNMGGIGSSIGFGAEDWGSPDADETKMYRDGEEVPESVVRKWNWLELSATAMPMNVTCQGEVVGKDERGLSVLDNLAIKGIIKAEHAAALGLPVKEKRRVVKAVWLTPQPRAVMVR